MIKREFFELSSEVNAALENSRPVVALESTVIAQGLPRPQNLESARLVDQAVRDVQVTPATIAILEGKFCVGLSGDQLNTIAQADQIHKISIRDLPIAVAKRWNGATTVAATIWIAHRVGIKVFATGGIGGVHRGIASDISADLPQLSQTPIIVVCSGAKIVLDLPATREWLETHGVTVVGYQCDEMPAFYSRTSGLPVDHRAESPDDVVQLWGAQRALGIESSLLVTVPVPAEVQVPAAELEQVLMLSLQEAKARGVSGRELTPFLLSQMSEKTKGATLRANIALLENNARVAAEIALSLAQV